MTGDVAIQKKVCSFCRTEQSQNAPEKFCDDAAKKRQTEWIVYRGNALQYPYKITGTTAQKAVFPRHFQVRARQSQKAYRRDCENEQKKQNTADAEIPTAVFLKK